MAKDGFYWYTDPDVIGQKFSVAAAHLPGELGAIVSEVVDNAQQEMRDRVLGMNRILTGAMYSSIDANVAVSRGGRVQGHFGFIDDAPFYTKFQEFGTKRGITPMHAFADASMNLQAELRSKIAVADIWSDLLV